MQDNQFVKKTFFEHLRRRGYTEAHLAVYDDYFEFLLQNLGAAKLMDLEPDVLYRAALAPVDRLDGEEVVEAYLVLLDLFMEFWGERWEAMHPEAEPVEGAE
jgi:hypothetical protein